MWEWAPGDSTQGLYEHRVRVGIETGLRETKTVVQLRHDLVLGETSVEIDFQWHAHTHMRIYEHSCMCTQTCSLYLTCVHKHTHTHTHRLIHRPTWAKKYSQQIFVWSLTYYCSHEPWIYCRCLKIKCHVIFFDPMVSWLTLERSWNNNAFESETPPPVAQTCIVQWKPFLCPPENQCGDPTWILLYNIHEGGHQSNQDQKQGWVLYWNVVLFELDTRVDCIEMLSFLSWTRGWIV